MSKKAPEDDRLGLQVTSQETFSKSSKSPLELGQTVSNKNDVSDGGGGEGESILDFDELLPYVGEFGTYQKLLFLLMIPFAFFVAWVYFSQIFMGLTPEYHWCLVPELMNSNLTLEQR